MRTKTAYIPSNVKITLTENKVGMKSPSPMKELLHDAKKNVISCPVHSDMDVKSVEKLEITLEKNVMTIEKMLDVNPDEVQFAFTDMESTL